MKKYGLLAIAAVLFLSALAGFNFNQTASGKGKVKRPIIIQGPMPIEAENFAKRLKNVKRLGTLFSIKEH